MKATVLSLMTTTKSFCNECVAERNHSVLHVEIDSGPEDDEGHKWEVRNETLKCLGCDAVSLRRLIATDVVVDEHGRPSFSVYYFPPAAFRRKPEWIAELSLRHIFDADKEFLEDLINEIYVCVQNNCRRAAGMAIRALLERVMIDKVGDKGSFKANIAAFESKGFISATQKRFLETAIEAGHATMHRAYKPSKKDIVTLVNITESVIESCYVHEDRAAELRKRIPAKK